MAGSSSQLANRILIGLGIGVLAGVCTLGLGNFFPGLIPKAKALSTAVLDPFGQIFLRLLFFVVIPLVFASLCSGVAQLGRLDKLGKIGARTFAIFFANMTIAAVLALVMMNILQPGNHLDLAAKERLIHEFAGAAQSTIDRSNATPDMSLSTLVEMFLPRNLFGAFVGNTRNTLGDVLPLILFAILVGAASTKLLPEVRLKFIAALDLVSDLMTQIVGFALRLAPYAVAGMLFSVIVKIGVDILIALLFFVVGCVSMILLHLFGTMSVFLKFFTKRSPIQFFRDIRTVLVTAFTTSSSNATLPTAIACAKDVLKVSPSTTGFVLPLGATMNMSGTALFEGCVVLFIAQVFGVELSLAQQGTLVILSVLSSVAVSGIPGGSLPLIAGLLVSFNIPAEGIGIILGVDRILDMTRTMCNVGCDLVAVVMVDEKMGDGATLES
jgi:Na+/H+-dicarboxylate symporter